MGRNFDSSSKNIGIMLIMIPLKSILSNRSGITLVINGQALMDRYMEVSQWAPWENVFRVWYSSGLVFLTIPGIHKDNEISMLHPTPTPMIMIAERPFSYIYWLGFMVPACRVRGFFCFFFHFSIFSFYNKSKVCAGVCDLEIVWVRVLNDGTTAWAISGRKVVGK